jgi:hypothetical protein
MTTLSHVLIGLATLVLAGVMFAVVTLSALALSAVMLAALGSPPAFGQSLGDIPANRTPDASCPRSTVAVDPSGHLRCLAQARN